tara:strand:- start:769 stop:969 length:201 start_codon:yes stop_codon:yes gene_type:complete
MIDAVTAYAEAHYSTGGWEVVVEAYTEEGIWEQIAHCKNPKEAIAVMRKIAKDYKSHSDDICSEAF